MRIHILSICGSMTTPLALALKLNGHQVSGSDQEKIYPPFSTQLETAQIPINQNIDYASIDLFIIGSAYKNFQRCVDEFNQIKAQNLPYISATEYLAKYVAKSNSILIAGSYGKSTVSALVSWILSQNNFEPSYFFGAQSQNDFPSLAITTSNWSVLEADESINGLDIQAKFLYYPTKYVILTSADWEHKDSYSSESDNTAAFIKLVSRIPQDGLLVYNSQSESATQVAQKASCPTTAYQLNLSIISHLLGEHNHQNVLAAATLCQKIGLSLPQIQSAINSFPGIKRRLEIINQDPLIIDDFAQAPNRVRSALDAVAAAFPDKNIKVFFEPHASFLTRSSSLVGFEQSFANVSEVVLSQIKFDPKIDKNNRVTFASYQQLLGSKVIYLPLYEDILKHYQDTLTSNDVLVHFSSGGINGLDLLNRLKRSILK